MERARVATPHPEADGGDLVREIDREFAERLMAAEADARCGATWGEVTSVRMKHRNGYRRRGFDTAVGSMELAIPELGQGDYLPNPSLEPRHWAEKELVAVVAECYVSRARHRAGRGRLVPQPNQGLRRRARGTSGAKATGS